MSAKELGNTPAYAHTTQKRIDRGLNGYEYKDVIAGGITLRQHFAGLVDVSAYSPFATFQLKEGRPPTVDELAAYIASIRVIEANALLTELAKDAG